MLRPSPRTRTAWSEWHVCYQPTPLPSPDVFPQLVFNIPRDRGIWELSRFAAASDVGAAPRSQIASPVAVQLMHQVLAIAAANQVHRLITISPVGMLRLLKTSGFGADRAGRSTVVDGARLEAVLIDVPPHLRASPTPTSASQPLAHAQRPLHGVSCR